MTTNKIDHRHSYYLVLDTETCNGFGQPLTYDIGFVVADSKGNIYERRSYIVYEIFFGEKELMQSAYYADKLPQYFEGIKSGEWTVKRFFNIRKEILELMEDYRICGVCAYNINFDIRALNCTMGRLFGRYSANFWRKDTRFLDIWTMACNSLLCQPSYDARAYKNGWVSDKGNVMTSAEKAYAHLIRSNDYEERHTALEDSIIETEILIKCFKMRVKSFEPVANPWRIPQPPFREYLAKINAI